MPAEHWFFCHSSTGFIQQKRKKKISFFNENTSQPPVFNNNDGGDDDYDDDVMNSFLIKVITQKIYELHVEGTTCLRM